MSSSEVWRGCSIASTNDGAQVIQGPNGIILMRSDISSRSTLREAETSSSRLVLENWRKLELLNRCNNMMLDRQSFSESANTRRATDMNLRDEILVLENEDGESGINTAYVGYSMDMSGPVFMKHPRARKSTQAIYLNLGEFNFKGNEFRVEPAGDEAGKTTIPHYLVTLPRNFIFLKLCTAGESFAMATSNRGDVPLDRFRREAENVVEAMLTGRAPVPLVLRQFPVRDIRYIQSGTNRLIFDMLPPSQTNVPVDTWCASGEILFRDGPRPSGFHYRVPLIEALNYPAELFCLFEDFAKRYPHDHLTVRSLLLAAHLWKDVTEHPDMQREECFKKGASVKWDISKVSLAVCLIYYSHWVRWTEVMGLAEYPHPFRFMKKAYNGDMKTRSFVVKDTHIDEERVCELLKEAQSRVPELPITRRTIIFPHMMRDSHMPQMIKMGDFHPPHKVELELTGVGSITNHGLPSYHLRVNDEGGTLEKIEIMAPRCIAEESFAPEACVLQRDIEDSHCFDELKDDITIMSLPKPFNELIWSPNSNHTKTWQAPLSQHQVQVGISYLPLPDFAPPIFLQPYLTRLRQRVTHLLNQGAIRIHPDLILRIGHDGLPEIEGMPLELEDDLRANPPLFWAGAAAEQRYRELDAVSDFRGDPPVIITDFGCRISERVIALTTFLPAIRHIAWAPLKSQLEGLPLQLKSVEAVKECVRAAVEQHCRDRRFMVEVESLLEAPHNITLEHFDIEIPFLFTRLMGIDITTEQLPVNSVWDLLIAPKAFAIDVSLTCELSSFLYNLKVVRKNFDLVESLKPRIKAQWAQIENYFDNILFCDAISALSEFSETGLLR